LGKGPDEPLASNKTAEGRAKNRRVTLRVLTEKVMRVASLENKKGEARTEIQTTGLRPGEIFEQVSSKQVCGSKNKDKAKLAAGSPAGILAPQDGQVLPNRIEGVRVRLDAKLKPILLLDGNEISTDKIGFTSVDKKAKRTLYSYVGIDFGEPGEHVLEIHGKGPFGNVRFKQSITVTRSGGIAQIKLVSAEENVADGKTPVRIRLALFDSTGKPISAPAELEVREGDLRALKGPEGLGDPGNQRNRVRVDSEGYACFKPVKSSGLYRTTLGYNDASLEAEIYVKPKMRDWILVGVAEGTVGYNTLSGNMESLDNLDAEDKLYEDGRVAFFAKGRVRGKWLVTMAYDTAKTKGDVGNSLFQTVDPRTYYTLYGDATNQDFDAASAKKLYVKIERDQFYALFGDYNTGLTVTELSRYSRSFNGIKSELQTRDFGFNVFASDTSQAFVRDEIRGEGISGLYRLSRRNIVHNSEKVVIQTWDRFRSEVILSERTMTRFLDYSIDYDKGTLFFKEPVFSKDEKLNPIFIIVKYESNDDMDEEYNYGGRGAVRFWDQRVEIGGTYIHEGRVGGEGDLLGADATVKITKDTEFKAEYATTDKEVFGEEPRGDAYLAMLTHRAERWDAKAYIKEQDQNFGFDQQNASEAGTRKFGLEGGYRLTETLTLTGLAYRHENLVTDVRRDVAEADVQYTRSIYTLRGGVRYAEDDLGDGTLSLSTQLTGGATLRLFKDRLQLRVDHDQSFKNKNENSAYPTRTTLGADYRLTRTITLFGEHEFTFGDQEDTQETRFGMKAAPWTGGQMGTTVNRQMTENGDRVFANLGLTQTWQVNEKWSLDAGVDRTQTIREPGAIAGNPININAPPPQGALFDFTAVTLGSAYQEKTWAWTSRLEFRNADNEDKWSLTTGAYGEPRRGLGLSAGLQLIRNDLTQGEEHRSGDLRLGLALRPRRSRWTLLNRMEFVVDERKQTDFDSDNWKVVNNLNANYKLTHKSQVALQYGAKYVKDTIDGDKYSGYTDLMGVQWRHNVSEKMDVEVRGSVLHSWNAGQIDYSTGVSVGYNIFKNIWASVGYNFAGFEDKDFADGNFTAKGPFVKFRLKMDQQTGKEVMHSLQRWGLRPKRSDMEAKPEETKK
jgi:hypothetical protein